MKTTYVFILLCTLILIVVSCTTNPFFDDEKNTYDRHTIHGRITLQNSQTADGVLVWMEDLNLLTFTSANGIFSLSLPNTPDYQGLNGAYKIFFYLGNYNYESASAVIRDGLFEYGDKDISGDGSVQNLSPLAEIVSISTRVLTSVLALNQPDSILIEVLLTKNSSSPITAKFYRDNRNIFTGFFIRNLNIPRDESLIFFQNSYRPVFESLGSKTTLHSYLLWDGVQVNPGFASLTEGKYEIFPFIFFEQEGLPAELILSFGPAAANLSRDYLNIPFVQTTDTFVVVAD